MKLMTRKDMRSRYASLVRRRHRSAQETRELAELGRLLKSGGGVLRAAKVWEIYSGTLAAKSKLTSLSPKQRHTSAIRAAAKKCDLTEDRVRRIVREWSAL